MNLFVRGGIGLVAVLFAAFLILYARPLLAETTPSLIPPQEQEKREPAETQAKQAPTAPSETASASVTVSARPAMVAKENDLTAASSITVANSTEASRRPLTGPQAFTAFSYNLRGRGASGLGVRRGTIAADPKILPYGTRVYLDAGSYSGEYVVTDCGTAIKGRKIDVWVPTIGEARRFGRKNVKLTVLSYGGKRRAKLAK